MGWVACLCFCLNLLHFSSLKSWDCSPVCLEAHWRCCACTDNRSFSFKGHIYRRPDKVNVVLFCTIEKGQRWKPDQASSLTQTRPLFETWKCVLGGISKLSRILVWQSLSSPHPSHWRVHPTVSRLKLIVRWNGKKEWLLLQPYCGTVPLL